MQSPSKQHDRDEAEQQSPDSATLTGSKRIRSNVEDPAIRRVKMLRSVSRSQGVESQASPITDISVSLDLGVSQLHDSRITDVTPVPSLLDLNRTASLEPDATSSRVENHTRVVPFARGIPFDLNAEDVASSVNQGLSLSGNHPKSIDVSECGSTTVSATLKDEDPLTRWKEMKQNGFLSSSHQGLLQGAAVASSYRSNIPVPKQRPKKSKSAFPPKKMDGAKREHADEFARIAAPSGLLHGLNLGIINHVRNRKQVHSIIEALVKSDTSEYGQSQHRKQTSHEYVPKEKTLAPAETGKHQLAPSHGFGGFSASSAGNKKLMFPIPTRQSGSSMHDKNGDRASVSHSAAIEEVEPVKTEVLSSAKACEKSSIFSNKASEDTSSVSLLSERAGNVAIQWLDLLHQDIKGRLSALRRSKKRLQSVITTELPFLISKEFSTAQDNVSCYANGSSDGLANNTLASTHLTRWTKLFDQMGKSLSEEEKQLESWLHDVREMQVHCEHGLRNFPLPGAAGFQRQGPSENGNRSTRELAVRAAAASIYSTCNFLMPKDNVSCF